jgi:hypothetical protein
MLKQLRSFSNQRILKQLDPWGNLRKRMRNSWKNLDSSANQRIWMSKGWNNWDTLANLRMEINASLCKHLMTKTWSTMKLKLAKQTSNWAKLLIKN